MKRYYINLKGYVIKDRVFGLGSKTLVSGQKFVWGSLLRSKRFYLMFLLHRMYVKSLAKFNRSFFFRCFGNFLKKSKFSLSEKDWLAFLEKKRSQQYNLYLFLNKKLFYGQMKFKKYKLIPLNFFVTTVRLVGFSLFLFKFNHFSRPCIRVYNFASFIKSGYLIVNLFKFKFLYSVTIFCKVFKKFFMRIYRRWHFNNNVETFLSKAVAKDWKKFFIKNYDIHLFSLRRKFVTAYLLTTYIKNLLKNRYTLMESVSSLMRLLRKYKRWFKGLVLRCKGRFSRKERASFSVFRLGKVSFSTLDVIVDYHSMVIVSKYGVCNITLWLSKY